MNEQFIDFKSGILSVITVCYNAENDIRRTLESISRQTLNGFEYIIIDGASKDKTIDVVNEYREIFKKKKIDLKVISEKDNGIYDAMNKGIINANNRWIEFLNAGDEYCDIFILDRITDRLMKTNSDIVYGDFFSIKKTGCKEHFQSEHNQLKNNMTIGHESCFIKREIQMKYMYSMKYHIASDYNSILNMYINECRFEHIDFDVINFYTDGISSNNPAKVYLETNKARINNGVITNNFKTQSHIYFNYVKIKLYYDVIPPLFIKLWENLKNSFGIIKKL